MIPIIGKDFDLVLISTEIGFGAISFDHVQKSLMGCRRSTTNFRDEFDTMCLMYNACEFDTDIFNIRPGSRWSLFQLENVSGLIKIGVIGSNDTIDWTRRRNISYEF